MNTKTILIIENNSSNAKLIKICLSKGGYDVLIADDAEEALKILKETQPDVILMDVKLTGMDSLQLSRLLKENPATKDIIVLALTTHAWLAEEEKILDAGCDGCIAQPFDTRTLANVVDKYLQRHNYENNNV